MAVGKLNGQMLGRRISATRDTIDRNGVDIAFETNLVYIDVNNGRIGIKKDNPAFELDINGTLAQDTLLVDTQFTNSDITISNAEIETALGSLNITAADRVEAPNVSTDSISVNGNVISSLLNSNIELRPDATGPTNGAVEIFSNTYVDGDVYATGNITFDGNITFGDANTDAIVLNADITSDIIPDVDSTVDLGESGKGFSEIHTVLVNAQRLVTSALSTSEGINLALRQENIWYVATNGLDTNEGDHQQGPYATVKQALSSAQSGDTVYIFPGTYQEEFPLTVPEGVTVKGENIRAVSIMPTVATQSNNAFLLNGGTSVEDLTVKDFYYDSVNDTGYAFSFAPGYTTTGRSPYIRNTTVLTRGSTTTPTDPRGFAAGDAGKGALVDGSVVDAGSETASMLFHSVTFITPGVDAITMTNGVRVEWLNSFTYFAFRGLYLTNGILGKANDATTFGAEIRSIGSANVYGTYGAVADGANTLGYLIGHNFAYIGTDGDENNDYGLVNQPNEYAEFNGGKIYTNSVDHQGDFRIGNIFVVDQQTGIVSFNAQAINFTPSGYLVLEGTNGRTYIDAHEVTTDNIKFSGNTISSLSGPVNFYAASNITTLNTNVNISGNIEITDNVTVSGNVYLGNDPLDTVTIAPNLTQTIEPDVDRTYNLGNNTDPKVWDVAFITELEVDEVVNAINNEITTIATDTDLRFEAAGTGIVHITSTDVQINNDLTINTDLTVNGDTAFRNVSITGDITQTGNINQTGSIVQTGDFHNNNIVISGAASYIDVTNIRIENNVISATNTDDDLIFTGLDAGGIKFDQYLTVVDSEITNTRTSAITDLDKSIIFTTAGTGNFEINSNTSLILPIGDEFDRDLDTVGQLRYNSTTDIIDGYQPSGNVSLINLYSSSELLWLTYPELVVNGTFNTDITGWTGTGTWDASETLVTAATGGTSQTVTVEAGITYDFIIDSVLRSPTLTTFSVQVIDGVTIHLDWDLTDINTLSGGDPSVSVTLTGSFTAVGTSATIQLVTVGGTAVFDNVSLIRQGTYSVFTPSTAYITPEADRGVGDNILRFSTNSQVQATIDENKLYTPVLHMGNIKLDGNTFSNLVNGNDISFSVTGTGVVNLQSANITIQDTTVLNLSNSALTFTGTDNGYLKVAGSNGLVIPLGSDPNIGGSMYFDQSVDQHIGMVLGWELNSSAYSAECWFKMTAGTSGTLIGASETNGFTLRINNLTGPNNIEVLGLDGTSNTFTCGAITLNSWNHIAACRDSSGNETVFLNGVRASSQTSNAITYNGATQYIGKNENGDFFTGYITSIRVQQDETKYDPLSSTIPVPIVPPKHNSFTRVCFQVLNEAYLIIDVSQQQEVTNYGTVVYSSDTPYTNTQPVDPEIGTTRLNANTETIEVYNGTEWIAIYGSSESVTLEEVEDIADIWGLILG